MQSLCFSVICTAVLSQEAAAPTPPENRGLREYKPGAILADPKLESWLKTLHDGRSPITLKTEPEFEQALGRWDPASAWYFRLKRNPDAIDRNLAQEALAQAENASSPLAQEAMYPYVLQALSESQSLDVKGRTLAKTLLLERGGLSCPRKRSFLQELRSIEKGSLKVALAQKYLKSLREFSALGFTEDSLRSLLYGTSPAALKELRSDFALAVQPFPRLVNDNPWLYEDAPLGQIAQGVSALINFAEKEAADNSCSTAQNSIIKAIKDDSLKQHLILVEAAAAKIETCWRSKGEKARLDFWQEIQLPLKNSYGFPGEALAQRRIGLLHWGRNQFENARKIFSQLLLQSEKSFPLVHAETLFTYARVVENEGKFVEAIEKYRFFMELYPNNEQANQALSSLVVLATVLKRKDDALTYALEIIEHEAFKSVDDRDSGTLPMALYWAGKIYLEKGETKNTEYFWGRVAQEFYSTFYGALGHYSLERLTQKRYMLPPMQAVLFDKEEIFREFPQHERRVLERAEKLLLAGLKEDAACEIKEIQAKPTDTHRQLARALFQYAAGDWLAAVKIYQNLPKSYRLTLPRGMERLLFPIAYGPLVAGYAAKLKVDPQYVNAIIRQESVFNPKAQSSVGAKGLMQLMPGTAKMEARSLQLDYVEPEKLAKINGLTTDESLLTDPEINVALGVHHVQRLLQKYRSPVFVLTSYNANPRATERWLESIDSSDMIVFIERIPYRETRSYVKLVMRNYFYYKRWYEGTEAALPLFEGLVPASLAGEAPKQYQASSTQ